MFEGSGCWKGVFDLEILCLKGKHETETGRPHQREEIETEDVSVNTWQEGIMMKLKMKKGMLNFGKLSKIYKETAHKFTLYTI